MPPYRDRRGGSSWWLPRGDLRYRLDHELLINALSGIDVEAIVEVPDIISRHKEMSRDLLRSHVTLLRDLALSELAIPWTTTKRYMLGVVVGMVSANVDLARFLSWANLVLRHLRHRTLEVSAVTRSGPHGDAIAYLLELMWD